MAADTETAQQKGRSAFRRSQHTLDGTPFSIQCPICLDVFTDPVKTRCGHVFCGKCIRQYIDGANSNGECACPYDRQIVLARDLRPCTDTSDLLEAWRAVQDRRGSVSNISSAVGGGAGCVDPPRTSRGDITAHCSNCQNLTVHQLVGRNVVARNVYTCRFCFCRSLLCRRCTTKMAIGGLWDNELCSTCADESPLHGVFCLGGGDDDDSTAAATGSGSPASNPVLQLLEKAWVTAHAGIGPTGSAARVLSCRELEVECRQLYSGLPAAELAKSKLLPGQVARAAAGGLVTGLGGLMTAAVLVPANVLSLAVLQIRLVCTIASLAGWQTEHSDQVKSMVLSCLTGDTAADIAAKLGVRVGVAASRASLVKLTNAIGLKLGSKVAGQSMAKAVPVIGGIVGAAVDAHSTQRIGNAAISVFFR